MLYNAVYRIEAGGDLKDPDEKVLGLIKAEGRKKLRCLSSPTFLTARKVCGRSEGPASCWGKIYYDIIIIPRSLRKLQVDHRLMHL
jgi:hypothetical protein